MKMRFSNNRNRAIEFDGGEDVTPALAALREYRSKYGRGEVAFIHVLAPGNMWLSTTPTKLGGTWISLEPTAEFDLVANWPHVWDALQESCKYAEALQKFIGDVSTSLCMATDIDAAINDAVKKLEEA